MNPIPKARLQPGRPGAGSTDSTLSWRRLASLSILLPGMALAAGAASAGDRDGTYHDAKNRDRSAQFQQADRDHDGKLSRAEFDAMSKSTAADAHGASEKRFDHPSAAATDNANSDRQNRNTANGKQGDNSSLFQRADTDNNGQLSRAEFDAITGKNADFVAQNARPAVREATTLDDFDDKDQDGDGKLSREEFYGRAALNASNDD